MIKPTKVKCLPSPPKVVSMYFACGIAGKFYFGTNIVCHNFLLTQGLFAMVNLIKMQLYIYTSFKSN